MTCGATRLRFARPRFKMCWLRLVPACGLFAHACRMGLILKLGDPELMLPAPPLRQPLQKRPAVQWDMGVLLRHGACAHESMSPQAGIMQSALCLKKSP